MQPPIRIPGFETEGELGRGAYSVVFRGRHGETPCAIKVPRWRGRSHRWFRREAVALARVNDPGLPTVMEVGEAEGVPYLVMELAEGVPLADRLWSGPLSEEEALDLGIQLCRTLEAVHSRGLVHRDVKPTNIVIEPESGLVRLIDFGFVTQTERSEYGDTAGTPRYAAPEQIQAPQAPDARADLYSAGAVLFECLTAAALPRNGTSSTVDPHALQLRLSQAGVSPGLIRIVCGLLAEDPVERYASGGQVLRDLERVQIELQPLGPRIDVLGETRKLPLLGRDDELQTLGAKWREASQGHGAVVMVEGEPGSGKSRLLRGLTDRIRAHHILVAQCQEGDPIPLATLHRLFEGYIHSLVGLSSGERQEAEHALREGAAGELGPLAALVSPRLAEVLGGFEVGITPRQLHEAFVESMAEFIRRFVRAAGPVCLCVDDLQWADPVSRDVLVRVAHQAPDMPLLMVVAARSGASEPSAAARFAESLGRDRFTTVPLGPLDEQGIAGMVRAYLGTEEVDDALIHRQTTLSGGLPLNVLEILEAFLDGGVLSPYWNGWRFDAEAAEQMQLPGSASEILKRRIADLPRASRKMLEAAAVVGNTFDDDLLGAVTGVRSTDLGYATSEFRRAGVIERVGSGRHRFVHDRVRETLLSTTSAERRRALHGRIAEVLDAKGDEGGAGIYELASHYALGAPDSDPSRTFATCRTAAERAAERFDNETALGFFERAQQAAARAGRAVDTAFYRSLAETQLRVGALSQSLGTFHRAFDGLGDAVGRAEVLGRIAWVHQMDADPDRSWEVLDRAFSQLGFRLPREDPRSVSYSVLTWARAQARSRRRKGPQAGHADVRRLQVLCDLHYQNARLGLEYGRTMRFLQSTLRILDVAQQLGRSPALAKSWAMYGFAMVALRRRGVGFDYLQRAQTLAEELGDQVTFVYCFQLQALARYWTGELDEAHRLTLKCLRDLGHWFEASEYCVLASNPRSAEALRGRPLHEWSWLEWAMERIRRSGRAPASFLLIERGMTAALTALGREDEIPLYAERFRFIERTLSTEEGFFGLFSWGTRIRAYTERADLGEEFEELIRAFEAEGHDAGSAHVGLYEYYVHLAHARVHQCLRASGHDRERRVRQLWSAWQDVSAANRLRVMTAHAETIRGYYEWLTGKHERARKHFDKAERIAEEETSPWVLYAVARGRAHLLRSEGNHEAARERARVAAMLAREHGAAHRLRWIGEEFDLRVSSPPPPRSTRSATSRSSRRRRQLQTLLHVVRASSRDLHLEQQARAVLDELVQMLLADRGLLVYENETGESLRLKAGGDPGSDNGGSQDSIVQRVQRTGEPWIGGPLPAAAEEEGHESGHVLAAPLILKERIVGVVCLERDRLDDPFTSEDRDLLAALAYQVLSALELTRLLEQRERLEESLRQAQKMEAVGRLAGGIAHDFNNMLTVIEASIEALNDRPEIGAGARSDLDMIADAAQRAKTLTRQLLAFSRRQVVKPDVHDPNEMLSDLAPMIQRLIGEHIKVDLRLRKGVYAVKVDISFLEQAIVNLAANARDAMPGGGTLTIETSNVEIDPDLVRDHVSASPGPHVLISVKDTGEGMPPDVQARIFDPFFTTKQISGTGLGLSTVYGFATQSDGHIEVESEPGKGTAFHLYLPKATEAIRRPSSIPPADREQKGSETVLLVEDEKLVRNSVRRILQRAGYHVLSAEGGEGALALVDRHGGEIALVITDVLMPDMSGPQLVERLRDRLPKAKVLYMSGYTDGNLVAHGVVEEGVSLLHKPFTSGELRERIRDLLQPN